MSKVLQWQSSVPGMYMLAQPCREYGFAGKRSAGVWQDGKVALQPGGKIRRFASYTQAISLAHRWCQGYDV